MQFYQITSDVLNCPFHPVAAGSTHDAALLFKTFPLIHLQYTFSFTCSLPLGQCTASLKKMLPIYLPTEHDELSCLNQLTYPVLSIIYFPSQKSSENEFSLIFFTILVSLQDYSWKNIAPAVKRSILGMEWVKQTKSKYPCF